MSTTETPRRGRRIGRHAGRGDLLAVGVLAFAVRLGYLLSTRGGLGGNYGYDESVYYAASSSLLHGQLPYADYTLLHPPGMVVALTPFALLGRLSTDHTGFQASTLAFIALAAVNAGLVAAICRRWGLPREAVLLAGGFYAVWFGAVGAEISARLEPLGSAAFLVGVLLLVRPGETAPRGRTWWGGAALGAAVAVKIWWLLPVLIVLVWATRRRPVRARATTPVFAAGAVLLVVLGPFFVAAPTAMWRMVVTDQLGRRAGGSLGPDRIEQLSSVAAAHLPPLPAGVLVVLAFVLLLALSRRAWRHPAGRLVVVLAWAQLVLLGVAPAYFAFYAGFVAPSVALLVGFATAGGADDSPRRVPPRSASRLAVLGAAVLTVGGVAHGSEASQPFPGRELASRVTHVRCLMVDSPMVLIQLDALTRNLEHHCPNWVDVTGRTYDVAAPPGGGSEDRPHNPRWQRDIVRYLRSGDAAVVARRATGLSRASRRLIRSWPVLARVDGITVYRTP